MLREDAEERSSAPSADGTPTTPAAAAAAALERVLGAVRVAAGAGVAQDGVGSSTRFGSSTNSKSVEEDGDREGHDGAWSPDELATRLHSTLASKHLLTCLDELGDAVADSAAATAYSNFGWIAASPTPVRYLLQSIDEPDAVAWVWLEAVPAGQTLPPRPSQPGVVSMTKLLAGEATIESRIGASPGRTIGEKFVSVMAEELAPAWKSLGGPTRRVVANSTRAAVLLDVELVPPTRDVLSGQGQGQGQGQDGAEGGARGDALMLPEFNRANLFTTVPLPPEAGWVGGLTKRGGLTFAKRAAPSGGILADPAALNKVGGLASELATIRRRVLLSRQLDGSRAQALGLGHVRGVLLHGPPGCGKTLLARQLAEALDATTCSIVSGPEVLNKFVGNSEERVRALFAKAEGDWKLNGPEGAGLHVVVFDELDAICRQVSLAVVLSP